MHEAKYYEKREGNDVRCVLCPQFCVISDGKKGFCGARANHGGKLYAELYAKTAACQTDPIEKKPLYHFLPGSQILSIGTIGCNFRCPFCQNWHLVDGVSPVHDLSPEEAVAAGCRHPSVGISYTYNEPFIWYEYVLDTGKLAHENGLKNVLVTNGFVNQAPLVELLPYIDAMNIDLKSVNPDFYKDLSRGKVEPVMETIKTSAASVHVEVTNLLITDTNDSDEDIGDLVDFVASVDPEIPMHFSRYFPQHKMDKPPTPVERLHRAYEIAREKMSYVYLGNLTSEVGRDTHCPDCAELLIARKGYATEVIGISDGLCTKCGHKVSVVM